jgi:hypothetical protein
MLFSLFSYQFLLSSMNQYFRRLDAQLLFTRIHQGLVPVHVFIPNVPVFGGKVLFHTHRTSHHPKYSLGRHCGHAKDPDEYCFLHQYYYRHPLHEKQQVFDLWATKKEIKFDGITAHVGTGMKFLSGIFQFLIRTTPMSNNPR